MRASEYVLRGPRAMLEDETRRPGLVGGVYAANSINY
jgi:hypothetical protein